MNRIVAAFLMLLVAGCLGNPLGHTDHEWRQMTPAQRAEARRKQAEIYAERDARLAQQQAAERRRLETLYRDAPYGSLLQCVLEDGRMIARKKPEPYQATSFSIVRGEQKEIPLESLNGYRYKLTAELSFDGLQITLCDPLYGNCRSHVAIGLDFQEGKSWRTDVSGLLDGAHLRCAYPPRKRKHRKTV